VADSTERRTRTAEPTSEIRVFLFAEVRDYTSFSQEHGDEEATRLVERFATLARQVIETRGGRVVELRGDEAMAVFGAARQVLQAATLRGSNPPPSTKTPFRAVAVHGGFASHPRDLREGGLSCNGARA